MAVGAKGSKVNATLSRTRTALSIKDSEIDSPCVIFGSSELKAEKTRLFPKTLNKDLIKKVVSGFFKVCDCNTPPTRLIRSVHGRVE